jgi:hypothetical protein
MFSSARACFITQKKRRERERERVLLVSLTPYQDGRRETLDG